MPLNAELTTIVEQLLSRTKSEGVPWTQAGSDSDFVVVVGDCPVTLSRMRSMVRDGDRRGAGTKMMVRLTVRDDGDSIVEQATVGEDDPDYASIHELWEGARRKALRVEETLRAVMEGIGSGAFSVPADDDDLEEHAPRRRFA